MTLDEARREYHFRTFRLAAGGSSFFKLYSWDRKTPAWRQAQRELFENICADIDRQKMKEG